MTNETAEVNAKAIAYAACDIYVSYAEAGATEKAKLAFSVYLEKRALYLATLSGN